MTTPTGTSLDLSPAPGAAGRAARWWAQARIESRIMMTNGEQLLLTLVIPVAALVAVVRAGLADVDTATPGVLALAILSSAFTATAIGTGFERRALVLKYLGTTPLGRTGLLAGKAIATSGVILLQAATIGVAAALMGWSPTIPHPAAVPLVALLGTVALGAWGFALAGLLRAEATLAVANAVFLVLMLAGGVVLPVDDLPGGLAAVAGMLPSGALGEALRAVLGGGGLAVTDVLLLVVWAAAGSALAARTFRWE